MGRLLPLFEPWFPHVENRIMMIITHRVVGKICEIMLVNAQHRLVS